MDILEPTGGLVEQVLGTTVAENPACDAHFVPIDPKLLFAIGEGHGNLSHAQGRTRICAAENDIGHLPATQGFGGLLAEYPAHGIQNVGFATAIGTNHCGNPFVKIQHSFLRKRLKTKDFE